MKVNRKTDDKNFDAQLEDWNMQIALFKAKADEVIAEAQIEFCKNLGILQRRQNMAGKDPHKGKEKAGDAGKTAAPGETPQIQ